MLGFELLYVTTGGKGRVISAGAVPAICLVSESKERILVLLFVSERAEAASAWALPKPHIQDLKWVLLLFVWRACEDAYCIPSPDSMSGEWDAWFSRSGMWKAQAGFS